MPMYLNPFFLAILYFFIIALIAAVRLIKKGLLTGFGLIIFSLLTLIPTLVANTTRNPSYDVGTLNNLSAFSGLILVILAILSFFQLKEYGGADKKVALLLVSAPLMYFVFVIIGLFFLET